jgi:lysozyme
VSVVAVPAAARRLAKTFEGKALRVYRCPAGFPTIGYGRLLSRDTKAALPDLTITDEQADAMLEEDLLRFMASVLRLCPVPHSEGQLAALIDFAFNLGSGNLQASTLRQKLLRGDYDGAADELLRWVMGGGRKLQGLVRRRAAERAVYLSE